MRLLLVAALLSFVTGLNAFAQEAPPKIELGGIRTIGDLLRQHNIELTQPALLQALKSLDADVRYLSAMKLAEDKVINAVPAIKEALAVETVSRDRANIALALGLLNDPAGRDELKGMCGDENFPPEFRLYAVRYMFDLGIEGDERCLHAAEQIVRVFDSENRSVGNRVAALELLVRFRSLTQEESQTVFDLVIRGLDDPEATVRMQASSALATLDDQDAVPYLQAAIAREKDKVIRSVLNTNLQKLQKMPKDKPQRPVSSNPLFPPVWRNHDYTF